MSLQELERSEKIKELLRLRKLTQKTTPGSTMIRPVSIDLIMARNRLEEELNPVNKRITTHTSVIRPKPVVRITETPSSKTYSYVSSRSDRIDSEIQKRIEMMKFCQFCGWEVIENVKICEKCGADLE